MFKVSGVHIHPDTESLQDSGYQGIEAYHFNSYVPIKKPQDGELTQLVAMRIDHTLPYKDYA